MYEWKQALTSFPLNKPMIGQQWLQYKNTSDTTTEISVDIRFFSRTSADDLEHQCLTVRVALPFKDLICIVNEAVPFSRNRGVRGQERKSFHCGHVTSGGVARAHARVFLASSLMAIVTAKRGQTVHYFHTFETNLHLSVGFFRGWRGGREGGGRLLIVS